MPMLNATNITLEAIIGVVVAGQLANVALFWTFWNKVHRDFVPKTECVLRDSGTRGEISAVRDEGRAACQAAAVRDGATQERIDELVRAIAARAAETILRDHAILSKIDALLARK